MPDGACDSPRAAGSCLSGPSSPWPTQLCLGRLNLFQWQVKGEWHALTCDAPDMIQPWHVPPLPRQLENTPHPFSTTATATPTLLAPPKILAGAFAPGWRSWSWGLAALDVADTCWPAPAPGSRAALCLQVGLRLLPVKAWPPSPIHPPTHTMRAHPSAFLQRRDALAFPPHPRCSPLARSPSSPPCPLRSRALCLR